MRVGVEARRGLTALEVIVVVAILGMGLLFLMMMLPRRQEVARRASCQRNLMQIGQALALYDQEEAHLPVVPALGIGAAQGGSNPLKALLETLALSDFTQLADLKKSPPKSRFIKVEEQPVRGFVCASDPNTRGGWFRAPISYRANTGSTPLGNDGPFAPGRQIRLSDIEAGDGRGYTAAFSERLVGNNQPFDKLENYGTVAGPLTGEGCPPTVSAWHGDAGASWFIANWQSTLYNHALAPNASPSCISTGSNSAYMGASSGHLGGVNVLFFDGSVKFYSSGVAHQIWQELATPGKPEPQPMSP